MAAVSCHLVEGIQDAPNVVDTGPLEINDSKLFDVPSVETMMQHAKITEGGNTCVPGTFADATANAEDTSTVRVPAMPTVETPYEHRPTITDWRPLFNFLVARVLYKRETAAPPKAQQALWDEFRRQSDNHTWTI